MEECAGDEEEEGDVDGELGEGVAEAEGDVEGDPGDGEPAGPVEAKEEADAGEEGEELCGFDGPGVGVACEQFAEVVGEADDADGEIETGDDEDGEGAAGSGRHGALQNKGNRATVKPTSWMTETERDGAEKAATSRVEAR